MFWLQIKIQLDLKKEHLEYTKIEAILYSAIQQSVQISAKSKNIIKKTDYLFFQDNVPNSFFNDFVILNLD